jgi:aspartate-semialdehyde dehydrogenase
MSQTYRVAIAGATGAVGVEFLRLLEERHFPLSELRLLASARSHGKTMRFEGRDIAVEELTENSFRDVDIAFFSAGGSRPSQLARAQWWWTILRRFAWIRRCRW